MKSKNVTIILLASICAFLILVQGCGSSSNTASTSYGSYESTDEDSLSDIADTLHWSALAEDQERARKRTERRLGTIPDTIGSFGKEPTFSFEKRRQEKEKKSGFGGRFGFGD